MSIATAELTISIKLIKREDTQSPAPPAPPPRFSEVACSGLEAPWETRPHENRKGEKMPGRLLRVRGVDTMKLTVFIANIEDTPTPPG